MLTSNFKKSGDDPNSIGISLGVPLSYHGQRYPALHPTRAMLKIKDHEQYRAAYQAGILDQLDAADVWSELHAMTESPILLCWEKANEFCHRRIVAEWLELHLGVIIPELGFDREKCLPAMEAPAKQSTRWYPRPNERFLWSPQSQLV
jgi:hypothetical protein